MGSKVCRYRLQSATDHLKELGPQTEEDTNAEDDPEPDLEQQLLPRCASAAPSDRITVEGSDDSGRSGPNGRKSRRRKHLCVRSPEGLELHADVHVRTAEEDSAATGVDGDQADKSAGSAGAVYVFNLDEGDTWSQQAYIKASNTDAKDTFGTSVSLSSDGHILAVGAPGEDSAATGVDGDQADNSASSDLEPEGRLAKEPRTGFS